jgi:hypothetical protein
MALKSFPSFLSSLIILILCTAFAPALDVRALSMDTQRSILPPLSVFINQVKNGQADQLRGIYIPDLLADPVVQQPSGRNDFVSSSQNILTQFDLAAQFGSTGLLAHNNLAGASFSLLTLDQKIFLVYGDGHVESFVVTEILRFQALDPASPSSTFVDLSNNRVLKASELFPKVYERKGDVVFQTCIASGESLNWGRLFVIAEPYPSIP